MLEYIFKRVQVERAFFIGSLQVRIVSERTLDSFHCGDRKVENFAGDATRCL